MRSREPHARRRVAAGLAAGLGALAVAGTALGWPWSVDMVVQRVLLAGRAPAWRPPPAAIPFQDPDPPLTREEAAARWPVVPLPEDPRALARGGELYGAYCLPCHGEDAGGGGPVARVFVPAPSLVVPPVSARPAGWIWGTIRDGGAVMPPYGIAVAPRERWEIVLYLRSLQARAAAVPPAPVPPGGPGGTTGGTPAPGGER